MTEIQGPTSRTLLVVDDPEQVVAQAVAVGFGARSASGTTRAWARRPGSSN